MRNHFKAPAAICLTALMWATSHAQTSGQREDPWYLGAQAGLTHISNVYRVSQQDARGNDNLRATVLLGGLHLREGRQTFKLDASLGRYDYAKNNNLDFTGYNANAAWDWALGPRWQLGARADARTNLAAFNPSDTLTSTERNVERNTGLRLFANYGLQGPWGVGGAVFAQRRNYSSALFDPYDLNQEGVEALVRWQPGASLQGALTARLTKGTSPRFSVFNGVTQSNDFTRNDLELSGQWSPSSNQALRARLGVGRSRNTEPAARNFSGTSGSLDWTWKPAKRWQLQAGVSRDLGIEGRQFDLGQFGTLDDALSQRTDALRLSLVYEFTAKIVGEVAVTEQRRLLGSTFASLRAQATDGQHTASLGARWSFHRNGQLACQLASDRRDGAPGFSTAYSASSFGCSAQWLIR